MFFGLPPHSISSPKKGFTLIELMIAISVIAILSTIGLMVYSNGQRLARDSRRKADLQEIKTALALYHQDFKHYPCTVGGNGWQFTPATTSSSFWISNVYTGITGCGSATDTQAFNTTHLNALPVDPMTNGGIPYNDNSYGYGYWASLTTAAGCPPVRPGYGNTFLLVAQLENDSDPDRIEASNISWCGQNLYTGVSGGTIPSGSSYVLTAD